MAEEDFGLVTITGNKANLMDLTIGDLPLPVSVELSNFRTAVDSWEDERLRQKFLTASSQEHYRQKLEEDSERGKKIIKALTEGVARQSRPH